MKVAVYSIQKTLFEGVVEKLIVHTASGQLTILDYHIPMIVPIVAPLVTLVAKNGEQTTLTLTRGILEVRPESYGVILADE